MTYSKLQFSKLKKFISWSLFGELRLTQILLNFKSPWWNLKTRGLGPKLCVAFLLFAFWKEFRPFKIKEAVIFVEKKNQNFNKNKKESKTENPIHSFRKINLCFSSYKNRELKVKLWWIGACERKKSAFFVTFILSEESFFNIRVLSKFIVYWINFENKYIFTYQKTLLHTLLLLVFKIVKSLYTNTSHDRFHVVSTWNTHGVFVRLMYP